MHSTAPDPAVLSAQTEPLCWIEPTVKHTESAGGPPAPHSTLSPMQLQPHRASQTPHPSAALTPGTHRRPPLALRHHRGHRSAGSSGRTDAERQQSPGQSRPHSAALLHRCLRCRQLCVLPKITAPRAAPRAPRAQRRAMGWWHRAGVTTSRTYGERESGTKISRFQLLVPTSPQCSPHIRPRAHPKASALGTLQRTNGHGDPAMPALSFCQPQHMTEGRCQARTQQGTGPEQMVEVAAPGTQRGGHGDMGCCHELVVPTWHHGNEIGTRPQMSSWSSRGHVMVKLWPPHCHPTATPQSWFPHEHCVPTVTPWHHFPVATLRVPHGHDVPMATPLPLYGYSSEDGFFSSMGTQWVQPHSSSQEQVSANPQECPVLAGLQHSDKGEQIAFQHGNAALIPQQHTAPRRGSQCK